MASVRRSDIIRKNRRMRSVGLRTALTAAACALLVLFAASGFGPGKRADSTSIRTQEAVEQLVQAPMVVPAAEDVPAAGNTEIQFSLPAPVQSDAPATPDVYLAAGNGVSEPASTPLQQPGYVQYTTPPATQTAAPAQVTPDVYYYVGDSAQTGTGIYYPSVTAAPVQTAAPAVIQTTVPAEPAVMLTTEPAAAESVEPAAAAEPGVEEETPLLFSPPSDVEILFANGEADDQTTEAAPSEDAAESAEPAAAAEPDVEEETPLLFSPSSDAGMRLAAEPDDETTSDTVENAAPILMQKAAPAVEESVAPVEIVGSAGAVENPAPDENPGGVELRRNAETVEREPEEQRVSLRGRYVHVRLLALLDGSEDVLPGEAELTRIVHVTLTPDDEYSGEMKLDVLIYGDFVYYQLYRPEGGARSYRASCALKELDSFLASSLEAETSAPQPSAVPTVDPYAGEALSLGVEASLS